MGLAAHAVNWPERQESAAAFCSGLPEVSPADAFFVSTCWSFGFGSPAEALSAFFSAEGAGAGFAATGASSRFCAGSGFFSLSAPFAAGFSCPDDAAA
jgi:hypothetical protein